MTHPIPALPVRRHAPRYVRVAGLFAAASLTCGCASSAPVRAKPVGRGDAPVAVAVKLAELAQPATVLGTLRATTKSASDRDAVERTFITSARAQGCNGLAEVAAQEVAGATGREFHWTALCVRSTPGGAAAASSPAQKRVVADAPAPATAPAPRVAPPVVPAAAPPGAPTLAAPPPSRAPVASAAPTAPAMGRPAAAPPVAAPPIKAPQPARTPPPSQPRPGGDDGLAGPLPI